MNLASAYPNSDVSALAMTVIAVVMVCTLAAWLVLVFLADRPPRSGGRADIPRAERHDAVWTEDSLPRAEGAARRRE
jgi:hypothetical protein